jgi:hypothetical protein
MKLLIMQFNVLPYGFINTLCDHYILYCLITWTTLWSHQICMWNTEWLYIHNRESVPVSVGCSSSCRGMLLTVTCLVLIEIS